MKKVINLLTEAWCELHGQKAYFIAFGIAVYLIAAMSVKKLDGTLGTVFLLFDILLAVIFHELFTEMRKVSSQQKHPSQQLSSSLN